MRNLIRPLAASCAAACPERTRPPEQRMEYHDKVLKCADCGAEFVFTAGEQMFFADKGFKNEPKRCKACKANRAQGSEDGLGKRSASGNENGLLAVRKRDDRSFQADAGAPGLLPRMLSAPADSRISERDGLAVNASRASAAVTNVKHLRYRAVAVNFVQSPSDSGVHEPLDTTPVHRNAINRTDFSFSK